MRVRLLFFKTLTGQIKKSLLFFSIEKNIVKRKKGYDIQNPLFVLNNYCILFEYDSKKRIFLKKFVFFRFYEEAFKRAIGYRIKQ